MLMPTNDEHEGFLMLRMGGQHVDAPVTRSWTAKGTLRQAAPHSIDRVAAMCTFSSATLGLTKVAASPSRGRSRGRGRARKFRRILSIGKRTY